MPAPLGLVIKSLLLDLLTTVGPPLSDPSKYEDLVVIYGTLLLSDESFWKQFMACNLKGYDMSSFMFSQKVVRMLVYTAQKEITPYVRWSLIICVHSTLAFRTPRYNGHPENTDSS